MIMDPRLYLVLGWGVVNGGMALHVASLAAEKTEQRAPGIVQMDTSGEPQAALVQVMPDLVLPKPDQKLKQTLERPLFVPTRRPAPPPPPPPPPPKPTMKKGQFQLMGVITVGQGGYAILREVAGGKVRRVEVGERVNDIRLSELSPDSATLTQYEDSEKLVLKVLPSVKGRTTGASSATLLPGNAQVVHQPISPPRRLERPGTPLTPQDAADPAPAEARPAPAPGSGAPPSTRFGP